MLRIGKGSVTLMHDLQNGRDTKVALATLQLSDFVLSNRSTRKLENIFSVKIGSAVITDSRNVNGHVFDKMLCRVQDVVRYEHGDIL